MTTFTPPTDLWQVSVASINELRAHEFQLSGSLGSCVVQVRADQVWRQYGEITLELPKVSVGVARALGVPAGANVCVRRTPYRVIDPGAWN